MQVSYQLTPSDFTDGIKSYWHRSVAWRAMSVVLNIAATALVAWVAYMAIATPDANIYLNFRPLAFIAAAWLFSYFLLPFISGPRQFRATPSAQGNMTLDISDGGLHFRSEFNDSNISWRTPVRFVEERSVFAIYINPRIFLPIPKRAFTPDQLTEFRTLLQEKVKH